MMADLDLTRALKILGSINQTLNYTTAKKKYSLVDKCIYTLNKTKS